MADEATVRRRAHVARDVSRLDEGDHDLLDLGVGVLGLILGRAEVPLDGLRRPTRRGDARGALGVGVPHVRLDDSAVAVPRPLAVAGAAEGDPEVLEKLVLGRDVGPVVEHAARLEVRGVVRVPEPRPDRAGIVLKVMNFLTP